MGFFSFLKVSVTAVRTVANTVNSILDAVQPVVDNLPAGSSAQTNALDFVNGNEDFQSSEDTIRIGLVTFTTESLLIESANLKRLNTLLYTISEQAETIVEPGNSGGGFGGNTGSGKVSELKINQFIWMQICTNIIAEVTFLKEVLLKTDPSSDLKLLDNVVTPNNRYLSLVNLEAGFAADYALTASHLDVLGSYQRSGRYKNYGGRELGRTDSWALGQSLLLDDDDDRNLRPFPREWMNYMRNLAEGRYGSRIREQFQE